MVKKMLKYDGGDAQLSQSKNNVFTSMKSFPKSDRFWQYNWESGINTSKNRALALRGCSPSPWHRQLPRWYAHHVDTSSFQEDASICNLSKREDKKKINPLRQQYKEHTLCNSQGTPSTIYLKQKWQTHNVDSVPYCLSSPPVSRSDVLPCARAVTLDTPGTFWKDWLIDAEAGSSSSPSVRGYGE